MLYMHFSPVGQSQWEASTPVKSKLPIAKVTRRNGHCSVTVNRALSREELDSLSAFMEEHERS